jgi:signal transduction histidine kinase
MKKLILLSLSIFLISTIQGQTCKDLPTHFNSYDEAVSKVEKATFKVKDKITCYGSSWITKATFHSCDGNTGYFILYTQNGKNYIHKGVPLNVWKHFKSTDSSGSYYSKYIKGKYQLKI